MQKLKKVMRYLGIVFLYRFYHRTIYMLWHVFVQEVAKTFFLLRCGKYSSNDEVLLTRLRTNAHILDKGLQAGEWMPGRGKSQYNMCVELIKKLENSPLTLDPSFKWANDKVAEYRTVQKNKEICRPDYKPIHSSEEIRKLLYDIIKSRRCARSFLHRKIEPEILEQLVSVVNWGPVSCNRQPTFLHITQKPELVKKCLEQCAGATGFGTIQPPCFIAVCADIRVYNLLDRNVPMIDVTFGIQNLLLLAHTYGIEGTVLNWMQATFRENKRLRSLLNIPKYEEIIFNIVLGYPRKAPPVPGRKDASLTYKVH